MADGIIGLDNFGQQAMFQAQQQQLSQQMERIKELAQSSQPGNSLSRAQRDQQGQIEESAIKFEAILVKQMLNSMWAAVPKDGLLTGSNEERTYRDMLNDTLSEQLARTQSIGIKDVIMKEMGGAVPKKD